MPDFLESLLSDDDISFKDVKEFSNIFYKFNMGVEGNSVSEISA